MKKIYNKVVELSRHRHAKFWLALLSFLESCVSPISPLVILIPMCLANPKKKWEFAIVATVAATIGSIFGYLLGYFLINLLTPILIKYNYYDEYLKVVHWFENWGLLMLLPASVLLFPPYKLFTIAAGTTHLSFIPFIIVSFVVRLVHFSLVPLLMLFKKVSWLNRWEKKHIESTKSIEDSRFRGNDK